MAQSREFTISLKEIHILLSDHRSKAIDRELRVWYDTQLNMPLMDVEGFLTKLRAQILAIHTDYRNASIIVSEAEVRG